LKFIKPYKAKTGFPILPMEVSRDGGIFHPPTGHSSRV